MVRHKAQNVSARPRTGDVEIAEDVDFKSMLLPEPILKGLKKSGYVKPSPIQKKALPLVRCGLDLIVQAKAGTGKTCVFTVAVLELVKPNLSHLQAIVLAPTREIALQITSVINAIGQCVEGLKIGCFIGGYPLSKDVENVKGCQVAVAAPGRLKHLLEKGLLNPRHVRLFVLDEADKLMEKVFAKDINEIFAQLPESKQVIACSATYTDELVKFLSGYMNAGQYVSPYHTDSSTLLLGVRQFVSIVPKHVDRLAQLKLKENHLLLLLRTISFNQCLIFSNLHTRAVSLCSLLRTEGWGVEWIAGRQEQKDRVAALTQMRDQRVRVLVTTDLTSRGIDIENINLVINLDLPSDHHTYLHRMGRAGRYGSHGINITVVSDGKELTAFQKLIGNIGGATVTVNRVPQNLNNINLWKMTDEKFEKICGIVDSKHPVDSDEVLDISTHKTGNNSRKSKDRKFVDDSSTSTAEKNYPERSDSENIEEGSTSTAEKYSPESDSEDYVKEYTGGNGVSETGKKYSPKSSNSEDYVKKYKGSNGATAAEINSPKSSDSEDYVKEYNREKYKESPPNGATAAEINSPESSDSEDYVKEYKREDSVEQINGAIDPMKKVPIITGHAHSVNDVANCKEPRRNPAEKVSVTSEPSTSSDEKYSPDSSDTELCANNCVKEKTVFSDPNVCNLYKADADNVKVIAGPSLFALRTQEHWRDVLPVIVNESKLPLNTPIASLDSKLFRVRFWDKSQKFGDVQVNISNEEVPLINFDCKSEENVFLNLKEIVSCLENGINVNNLLEDVPEHTDHPLVSSESIENTLKSSFGEIGAETCNKSSEIDHILLKYNLIKERSERALICFDSFDLVGWLAVDQLHNIIEEINIDKCEVYEFKLVTCPAGENHIEVLSSTKGSSKEMNDYIDYITTLNIEGLFMSTNPSLSNIAKKLKLDQPNSLCRLLCDSDLNATKTQECKQDRYKNDECNIIESTVAKANSLLKHPLNKPVVNDNNNKPTVEKDVVCQSMNESENPLSLNSTVTSLANSRNTQSKCRTARSSSNNHNKKRVQSENGTASNLNQVSKHINGKDSQVNYSRKQHKLSSDNIDNAGVYVDLNWKPKNVVHAVKLENITSGDIKSLRTKPEKNHQVKSKSKGIKAKIEHSTNKHRNSDDSYDSCDSVEYETTDLDKKISYEMPHETKRKHHLAKHQISTKGGLIESNNSHKFHNPKVEKPQVSHHRSKPVNYRNKQSYKNAQDAYLSNEYETGTPSFQSPSVTSAEEEQERRNKHQYEGVKPRDSKNESFDSISSIEFEISKLRELNSIQNNQFIAMKKQHEELGHNKVLYQSDGGASVESGGTNRHSFKTACSEHCSVDQDSSYEDEKSIRYKNISKHNRYIQTCSNPRTTRHSVREYGNQRRNKLEERTPQVSGDPQTLSTYHPDESCNYDHHQINQERVRHFTHHPQNPTISPESGSLRLKGENLQETWYTDWYLRVRQRAIQLAMMEYTNTMSSL